MHATSNFKHSNHYQDFKTQFIQAVNGVASSGGITLKNNKEKKRVRSVITKGGDRDQLVFLIKIRGNNTCLKCLKIYYIYTLCFFFFV